VSVFLGTPAYDGKIHWTTVQGLIGTAHTCAKANVGICMDVIPHDAFIGKARNMIAHRFLKSGMNDLLFIDADIGFEPQSVVDLCKAAPDIVMGLYMMKTDRPRYPALMTNPIFRHPTDMRLIKVLYGPTGFMRIRRRVFEKMMEEFPEEYYIDGEAGKVDDLFPHGRYDHRFTGEDIKFCERAVRCGFNLWAMQGIPLRHFGEKSWDSCWQIDRKIPGEEPAEMGATEGYMSDDARKEAQEAIRRVA